MVDTPKASLSLEQAKARRVNHLEFQNTIEGVLVRGLGADLTPELKAKLRTAGLDLDRKLLPAYPAAAFHEWVELASHHLWPTDSRDEALRKFGRRSLSGLADTMLGKAMKLSLTLIGTRRMLLRATRAFRSNNNYTEVTIEERSPTSMSLAFNDVYGAPTYYQGILEIGCEFTGTKGAVVQIENTDGLGARYVVTWDE